MRTKLSISFLLVAVTIWLLILAGIQLFGQPMPTTRKARLQSPRESSVQVNSPMSLVVPAVKTVTVTLNGKYPLPLPRASTVITIQRCAYMGAPWENLMTVDSLPVTFTDTGEQAMFRTVTHKRNL